MAKKIDRKTYLQWLKYYKKVNAIPNKFKGERFSHNSIEFQDFIGHVDVYLKASKKLIDNAIGGINDCTYKSST